MAETARFPQRAAQHFDVMFTEVHTRLSAYLKTTFGLSARASAEAAQKLLGQLLYPQFVRALFGMDKLAERFDREALAPDFDLRTLRTITESQSPVLRGVSTSPEINSILNGTTRSSRGSCRNRSSYCSKYPKVDTQSRLGLDRVAAEALELVREGVGGSSALIKFRSSQSGWWRASTALFTTRWPSILICRESMPR